LTLSATDENVEALLPVKAVTSQVMPSPAVGVIGPTTTVADDALPLSVTAC
jgi:hypothetical protein